MPVRKMIEATIAPAINPESELALMVPRESEYGLRSVETNSLAILFMREVYQLRLIYAWITRPRPEVLRRCVLLALLLRRLSPLSLQG